MTEQYLGEIYEVDIAQAYYILCQRGEIPNDQTLQEFTEAAKAAREGFYVPGENPEDLAGE